MARVAAAKAGRDTERKLQAGELPREPRPPPAGATGHPDALAPAR